MIVSNHKKIGIRSIILTVAATLCWSSSYATEELESKALPSVQSVIIASQKATFSSPMRGKIVSLNYDEGNTFTKGSTLFAHDCTILKASLREKNAAKNAAWAKYISTKKLKALNSASELELTLSLMDFRKTDAAVEISEEQIKLCKTSAPYNGRVIERKVNLYETVNEGQEMMSVISTDKLHSRMLVPSQWLSWLNIGTNLQINIHEFDETYPAKIIRIGGAVDEVSQSIMVISEISDPSPHLLPGMSGTATFPIDSE